MTPKNACTLGSVVRRAIQSEEWSTKASTSLVMLTTSSESGSSSTSNKGEIKEIEL